MDIFIEQLVKRKTNLSVVLINVCTLSVAALLSVATVKLGCTVPLAATASLFVLIGIFVLTIVIIRSQRVEFEYAIVDNEFVIDKIIDKRKRKHLLTFDMNSIKKIGKYSSLKSRKTKIIKSCSDEKNDSTLFVEIRHVTMGDVTVLISPNEKIMDAMKPFIRGQELKDDCSWN